MAEEDMVDHISGDGGRRLPVELGADLAPPLRHALDHPLRRQILRALASNEDAHSPSEIAATWPESSVSLVSYHAHVLESCGGLSLADVEPAGDTLARRYTSAVANDAQVAAILAATESLDIGAG
jgi:hypothetical protein